MADNTAPFIITTQLDLSGINAGLTALSTKLAGFRAPIVQTGAQQGTVGGLSPKVVKDTGSGMKDLSRNTGKMTGNMRRANRLLEEHNNKLGQTSNLLGDVSRRVFVWGAAAALIFGALSNLKEFFDLTIATNTAMAELKKVLPQESDFEGLKAAGFDLSIEFGTAPADVFKILKRFGQSGLEAADAIEATRTALLALNVTGADVEKVFNAIIGANKIFGVSFENSTRIIDKIQAVQAQFAVDSKDLIASIQGIGPAITILGGDIDDLFGNIAALSEAARVSGKEASNSLKRVFSRIIAQEGIQALKAIGVQVFATSNTFRPLRSILQDIADKWETLTPAQRANLAITLAQVRQYSKLTALFQNFDRATEAIKISQNASGDAFRANEAILATFAKQTEIATNQLSKLAEEVILKGGIADFFTSLKVGSADIISSLNPAIVSLVTNLAGLGVAALAVTFIFPRATFVLNEHTAAQLGLALAIEDTTLQKVKLEAVFAKTSVSGLRRVGQVATIVGIAFIALSVIWGRFTRDTKRRNRIIEAGVKQLSRLTDQINKFQLAGRGDSNISNFDLLTTTFKDLKRDIDSGILSIEEATEKIKGLFIGVGKNATKEQLKLIIEQVDILRKGIEQALLLPFFEETRTKVNSLSAQFNEFTRNLETSFDGGATSANRFLQILNKINKLPVAGALPSGPAGGDFIPNFEISNLKAVIDANRSVAETFAESVQQIVIYQAELDILSTKLKDNADAQARFDVVTKLSTKTVDETAAAIVQLIDPVKFFGDAAKSVAEITEKGIIAARTQRDAKASALVFKAVVVQLKAAGKEIGVNATEITKLLPLIDSIGKAFVNASSSSVTGIDAISFSTTAFLSALKKTTGAVITGFAAQFRAIRQFSTLASGIGNVFDTSEETLKTVDDALNRILTTIKDNARSVASLTLEMEGLGVLRDELAKDEEIALIDKDAIPKLTKQVEAFRLKIEALGITQRKNREDLEGQVTALLKLRQSALTVVEAEKRREQVLKAQTKLFSTLTAVQIGLTRLKFTNLTEALKETIILRKRLLDVQLEEVDKLVDSAKLEKEKSKTLKDQLVFQFNIAGITDRIAAKQQRLTKLYGNLRDSAKDVGQVFADMLGDQEAFFDILESKGSLMEIFKQTAAGIADVVARGDAQIIGNAISGVSKGLFKSTQDEIKKIRNEINEIVNSADLGLTVKDPIIEGGKTAGALLKQGILDGLSLGSTAFAATFAQELLATIKEGTIQQDLASKIRIKKELAQEKAAAAAAALKAAEDLLANERQRQQSLINLGEQLFINAPILGGAPRIPAGDPFDRKPKEDLVPKLPSSTPPDIVTDILKVTELGKESDRIEVLKLQLVELRVASVKADSVLAAVSGAPKEQAKIIKDASDKANDSSKALLQKPTLAVSDLTDANARSVAVLEDIKNKPLLTGSEFLAVNLKVITRLEAIRDRLLNTSLTSSEAINSRTEAQFLELANKPALTTNDLLTANNQLTSVEKELDKEAQKLSAELADKSGVQRDALIGLQIKTIEIMAKANSNLDHIASDDDAAKRARAAELVGALTRRLGTMVGQALGFAIAKGRGADTGAVSTGSNFGGIIGGIIGATQGNAQTGNFIGSVLGSILGGFLGGKKEEEEKAILTKIERNTAALVDRLTPEIFNAPANFVLPSGRGSGGSITITNNFNVTDGSISDGDLRAISNQVNSLFDRSGSQSSILTR